MKVSAMPYADAALALALLLAPLPAVAIFNCELVVSEGQQFNLKALGGPHSVVTSLVDGHRMHNTTYTLDICAPLKKKKDVQDKDQCPTGTRVCAITHLIDTEQDADLLDVVVPLAGELEMQRGGPLDPKVSPLRKADPKSGKEGLRVVFKGGFGYMETQKRKKQTVIDFVCNKDLDGNEGEYDVSGIGPHEPRAEDGEGGEDGEDGDEDQDGDGDGDGDEDEDTPPKEVQLGIEDNPSLVFDRYGPSDSETNVDVLHLTWSSKHVCQSKESDGKEGDGSDGNGDEHGDSKKSGSHWGIFTWIVLLFFLGTAAYLIFGSWLNYNRYGARGWDLLPHGDTIRDIPYLLKDWARRVLNTVQGSGSRGGYSAV